MKSVDESSTIIDVDTALEIISHLDEIGEIEYVLSKEVKSLRQHLAEAEEKVPKWLPIESAPKDRLVDIWIKNSDGSGGYRWSDCYYDKICDEWRTSSPSGFLMTMRARNVSHYMPPPAPPEGDKAP